MHTKHHYQAIIEDVNDAIYTTDLKGNFTSVNPAGERITGYTKKEFLKLHMSAVVAPEYLELVVNMIKKKINDDVSTMYEIEIMRKDGTRIPVEISSRALFEGRTVIGVIGIARDITERKTLEQQKDVFFSLVTHEIKNPLSSIKAFAELLKKYHEKHNEKEPKHFAQMIDEQVNSLTVLINDFLDISKMNAGKFTYTKEQFDLTEKVGDVIETFNTGQAKNRIKQTGKEKILVYGDPNRIGQVLNNLLTNALKYSPPESLIQIAIALSKEDNSAVVKISNDGPGIPEEKQEKIFELFYRMNTQAQKEVTGHGLGLYVCKQIILGHKGSIWVESKNDRGSTFCFSLPLYKK